MTDDMMRKYIMWTLLAAAVVEAASESDDGSVNETSATVPGRSMHRLVSSVAHYDPPPSHNSSAESAPFLPVQALPGHSATTDAPRPMTAPTHVDSDRFTPSYFLGEVIPEPYVPERFQNSRVDRNSSTSWLVPSQSSVASRKVPAPGGQTKRGGFFPSAAAYVPPVREESAEEASTTAKYAGCCGDGERTRGLYSPRPVTFDDVPGGPPGEWGRPAQHEPRDHPYPFDVGGGPHQSEGGHQAAGDWLEHYEHSNDLVVPSPFYPTEPNYRLKDVRYKVYQHPRYHHHHHHRHHPANPTSPLKGLLHAAAALLPVGLLVASLYPNVLHVNATDTTVPTRQRRSLDGEALAKGGRDAEGGRGHDAYGVCHERMVRGMF